MNSRSTRINSSTPRCRLSEFCLLEDRACPSVPYEYAIVAQTGKDGITSIQPGASANDYGKTAFVASDSAGQSIYVVNDTKPPVNVSFASPSAARTYGAELQINNGGIVGAIDNAAGSSPNPQRHARGWDSNSPHTNLIIARSSVPPINTTFFDSLGFYTSITNDGLLAFAGLESPAKTWEVHASGGLVSATDDSRLVTTFPTTTFFRPMAADNNRVVVGSRAGPPSTSMRIVRYDGYITGGTGPNSTVIARTVNGPWTALGVRPGISDDGRAIAFYGEDANGPGVFVTIDTGGAPVVRRMAGVSGNGKLDPLETFSDLNGNGAFDPPTEIDIGPFAGFSVDTRVAVEHALGAAGTDRYALAFLATPAGGGTALFAVQVDATTQGFVTPSLPIAVVGVGATVAGVAGTVQSIAITDPLNAAGDVTFVVDNGGGVQAVLRASLLDSDQDGLFDIWETNGIDLNGDGTPELDLPALGADPFRKDLFVEIDAMSGFAPRPATATYPIPASLKTATVLDGVIDAFYRAPVPNPTATAPTGGPPGVNLHVVVDDTGLTAAAWGAVASKRNFPAEFYTFKQAQFGTAAERLDSTGQKVAAKRLAFRYAVFAKSYQSGVDGSGNPIVGSSGRGDLVGNDLIVTLGGGTYWPASPTPGLDQAGTFMHELGHTLGLYHGGDEPPLDTDGPDAADVKSNYKPNYRSIMNYTWQAPARLGATPSAALVGYHNAWRLDYSRGTRNVLLEGALDEPTGIGGDPGVMVPIGIDPSGRFILVPEGGPADFDQSGGYSTGVVADLNNFENVPSPGQVLTDHNDWAALRYDFRRSPYFADGSDGPADDHPEMTDVIAARLSLAAQLVPDAHVAEFRVNDAAAQRSRVTSLRVTLDRAVALSAANFTLAGFAGTLTVASAVVGGQTVATITFAGGATEAGSLADGRYRLTVSGVPGLAGATAFDFHRLFGDADGDADVDALDLFQFRRAFGSTAGQTAYRLAFDFDGDGRIDNADLIALRLRLGRRLP